MKKCSKCSAFKPRTEFYQNKQTMALHSWCKPCLLHQNKLARDRKRAKYGKRKVWHSPTLDAQRELNNHYHHKRRAIIKSGDRITVWALYKRDKGICGICSSPCHRGDASIDYRYPLSKGGSHTWDNVQLAHLTCNLRKQAKLNYGAT